MKKVELPGNKTPYLNNIMMKSVCCGLIFSSSHRAALHGYHIKIYYNWSQENTLLLWHFETDTGAEDSN